MTKANLRIVSLIPSATEIVAALGLASQLVGRSHECDYPADVVALPICTAPNLDPQGSSQAIHAQVETLLQAALSIYRLDLQQLQALQPTHIITQAQCEVCAVSLAEVQAALAHFTGSTPQVISLQPAVLADVWQDIEQVAAVLGVESELTLRSLHGRLETCQQRCQVYTKRPNIACIEWTDPLMAAGNWVPELVAIAGGKTQLGQTGQHSPWLAWSQLLHADPDMIVLMPCGFDLSQTRQAAQDLITHPQWSQLRAVQTQQVYLTDGNQYFNRPGPRLVDSVELLAEILHPPTDLQYHNTGWQLL